MNNWQRRSFVTRGSDPTQVVVWYTSLDGGETPCIEITEFQNVYTVDGGGDGPHEGLIETLGRELHQSLEREFEAAEKQNEDVNFFDGIYGHE
jgi:hypothetical protein